jgi:hypothetical protein
LQQYFAALFAGTRPHFNNPVGFLDEGGIVVDEDKRVPAGLNLLEDFPEGFDVALVQTAGGFVEDNQEVIQVPGAEARKPKSLDFATRQGGACTPCRKVSDIQIDNRLNAVYERAECGLLLCRQSIVEQGVQPAFEFRERRA